MFPRCNKILIVVIILSLLVCTTLSDSTSTSKGEKRTIVDRTGREVQIPVDVQRIAITPMPWTSVLYAVDGSGKKIVGMNPSAKKILNTSLLGKLAPELYDASSDFCTEDFTVNLEELLKLKPDLLIQWDSSQLKDGEFEKDEEMGIPVVAITYGTPEDLKGNIKLFGELVGKEDRAQKFIDAIDKSLNYISPKVSTIKDEDKPSVFYLDGKELKTRGNGSFQNYAFTATGARNVAHELGSNANANMEQIIAWNPDIIYVSNFCNLQPSDLYENTIKGQDWSNINAVKNKRVYKIPQGLYRWDAPSTETPLFLKWLAQTQHPELFSDYSMIDEVQTFFKDLFNYEISDADAKSILRLN
jgi:iron complex transport system substrate-binding protein